MTNIILYCADLAIMGIDEEVGASFEYHDWRRQTLADDIRCRCLTDDPCPLIEFGQKFSSSIYGEQSCRNPYIRKVNDNVTISLCCTCADTVPNFDTLVETVREFLKSDKSRTTNST